VREAAFLKQLSKQPEDVATVLVYADWLEDHGAADRAEFLRLQQQVLQMRHRQKGFSETSRRLLRLGRKLAPDWLAVVSRPRLSGTCWSGVDSDDGRGVWRYLPDGVLNYTYNGDVYQNGTWRQVGTCVLMEMNRHYADYEGFVGGDWLRGTARNVDEHRWRWKAQLTTDPALCDPTDAPDTTVYDGHLRR